jgi:superfamily I DNA/RNA helicase
MPSKLKEWQVTHTARTGPEETAEEMLRLYIEKNWAQMLVDFADLMKWDIADASKIVKAFKTADVMLVWKEDQ